MDLIYRVDGHDGNDGRDGSDGRSGGTGGDGSRGGDASFAHPGTPGGSVTLALALEPEALHIAGDTVSSGGTHTRVSDAAALEELNG